ncbi:MAG: TetR/AcrR family transcriptional regulator [Acidimicrobiia bacterium]|nr:TetR/AcrR family transcriptional regulator [Acidimicrobiia bacterium]
MSEPAWRERAVSRSLTAARSRAEQRVQRFLEAAFSLIDEKGTTDFTIQEVIDRSEQSLRAFYQHFNGKDELLLALFEETVQEAADDIRLSVEAERKPLERLRVFVVSLHGWCAPEQAARRRGSHNRLPIMDFMLRLAADHPERVKTAMTPVSSQLVELLDEALTARVINIPDTRRSAALVQQTIFSTWLGDRLVHNPRARPSAQETWEFCLHGLGG